MLKGKLDSGVSAGVGLGLYVCISESYQMNKAGSSEMLLSGQGRCASHLQHQLEVKEYLVYYGEHYKVW
jgi:hypothetical protein